MTESYTRTPEEFLDIAMEHRNSFAICSLVLAALKGIAQGLPPEEAKAIQPMLDEVTAMTNKARITNTGT